MTVNRVILVGNLGQDPEIRSTNDGRELANFSIATTESWKDKVTGERRDKTEWHRIVVFSQGLVKIIKEGSNWIKKGTKIYIEGQLQTRKWTDNNGVEKYSTEIILNDFNSTFNVLSNDKKGIGGKSQESGQQEEVKQAEEAVDEVDSDIPF